MEFRDLKRQYEYLKEDMDKAIQDVITDGQFIMGKQVMELEKVLSEYVGKKHCITCANGTDALQLALMAWDIGPGDAVFVPDFTFFSSGEVVVTVGATPIFVDVCNQTYNIDTESLKMMIEKVKTEGKLVPKVIIAVDLFGQPANYDEIKKIAKENNMFILEDAAQGFGGKIGKDVACSFGDISITSFFPAKPLGCYGDGGAIFTDDDEWNGMIRSLRVHGKGVSKYDNIRIGMNSRLDTLQAAVLLTKFSVFVQEEMEAIQTIARKYTKELMGLVKTPIVLNGYVSSWAQYTIQLADKVQRDGLQEYLKRNGVPSMIYYQKPMHCQRAFEHIRYNHADYKVTNRLCDTVLSLPFHPYMAIEEVSYVTELIKGYLKE
ncbi:MAG: DegT/DnrJ/EryC1/StrS family aminotransferase [Lachnospiraceae bacterium]|nr:DegT/DnrJ/EryC1/StrS family aminotransferase [Lachnospiraceae bacterium]MBQ3602112.1 DegT/DnrJ/EryC1/StrS family aminotransferase [Lachnospiraceae bacterium]